MPELGLRGYAIARLTFSTASRTRLPMMLSTICSCQDWQNGHKHSAGRVLSLLLILHVGQTTWCHVYAARLGYRKRRFTSSKASVERCGPSPRSDIQNPQSTKSIQLCLDTSSSGRLMLVYSMPGDLYSWPSKSVRHLVDKPWRGQPMASRSPADCITGRVMGFLYEHQRTNAPTHVRFNCRALDQYPIVERMITSVYNEPAFHPGMSAEDRMNLV